MQKFILLYGAIILSQTIVMADNKYEPTWESLDKRPLPKWYDEAKIGIFLHWGVYAVPSSVGGEWFWAYWKGGNKAAEKFMQDNYPPRFTYQDFARDFTAEFFDPHDWAELFRKSGAQYVTLTSKHHDGFTMWPSKHAFGWNAKDVGPNRDLVGDLAKAVRNATLKFGLYYSLYEWFNPLYETDAWHKHKTNNFSVNKVIPELHELVHNYSPDLIWVDGEWEANDTYWKTPEFLAWLYNESPVKDTIAVNDRWGKGIGCHHGGFFTCKDRYNPKTLQKHKFENTMTLDKYSWGYRRDAHISDILTSAQLIQALVETISCGGNIAINLGPTHDGRIETIFQERLLDLGKWLHINGKAIYKSTPWKHQNDTLTNYVWYTSKGLSVFAISLKWPKDNTLKLGAAVDLFKDKKTAVTMLGNTDKLKWSISDNANNKTVNIQFPDKATVACDWAWALQIDSSSTKYTIDDNNDMVVDE